VKLLLCTIGFGICGIATAQDPVPEPETLEAAFPAQKSYSPYANRNFPTQVFWGETHLHTGMSMDAGAFGARLSPADAYRFAKGEEVVSSTGQRVKLSRPLDFLVVADHSDNMGFFPRLYAGEPSMLADPTGRRWYDGIQAGGQDAVAVAVEIVQAITGNSFPEALASLPGTEAYASAWAETIEAAESADEPGNFTAFIGYEWTSTEKGINLHRVVVYRDDASKASVMEPYTTLSPSGSPDPLDLWKWMADYEAKSGGRLLAIAHNGNMSNGHMFPESRTYFGGRVNRGYAQTRARWEPLYEATQIKGDGEAHPFLSPTDEFADYETWDQGNLDLTQVKTAEEENFFGKHSGAEPNAQRVHHPMARIETTDGVREYTGWGMVASGYQGVWATENTRAALFDAMMRKETYATTGPRMLVRFFGGWDFTADDAKSRLPANAGYMKGVPMGGDLTAAPAGKAPTFLVGALKDPLSGNLDRIQIIKGWLDERGRRQEKIYDIAWSGDRQPGADGRLPPVGNTVDIATATWSNSIGSPELITAWIDPDFDPDVPAVYYARIIEIPTPRWTAYEAVRFGIDMPDEIPMTTQERAYTSPIWYTP
jgi:hypothetical protein